MKFKSLLYKTFGSVYVPKNIIDENKKYLLHISDTPENFYPALNRLIKKINPYYIVHTGDLVDNFKLEFRPFLKNVYKKRLLLLRDILESSSAKKIYISLGNHDEESIVNSIFKRATIFDECTKLNISSFNFNISHFPEEIVKSPSEYNLFGHNISIKNKIEDGKIFLNGILSINLIDLDSGKIYNFPYPMLTNDARLGKHKIGI